jgi:hypothetical protein
MCWANRMKLKLVGVPLEFEVRNKLLQPLQIIMAETNQFAS